MKERKAWRACLIRHVSLGRTPVGLWSPHVLPRRTEVPFSARSPGPVLFLNFSRLNLSQEATPKTLDVAPEVSVVEVLACRTISAIQVRLPSGLRCLH